MKKRDKWMLGIGTISIGVGLILGVIGWKSGGLAYASYHESSEAITDYTISSYFTEVEGVTSIDFDIPVGNVQIEVTDKFSLMIDGMEKDEFESRVENGVWRLSTKSEGRKIINHMFHADFWEFIPFFRDNGWEDEVYPYIYITIPETAVLKKAEISVGTGEIWIYRLNSKIAELEINAGNMILNECSISKSVEIDIGAGNFTIEKGILNNLDLDCGAGEAYIYGDITGKSRIDCGVGSVTVELNGSTENYYYIVDCGIGSAIINDISYNYDTKVGNKNAKNQIKVDCGVGQIYIYNSNLIPTAVPTYIEDAAAFIQGAEEWDLIPTVVPVPTYIEDEITVIQETEE